ncbi:hypothetical protein C1Y40_05794 [Mycobacterium talmoniae]|uniref:Uncharacterized protein n=1 Tax=Mycobacterium talmoniae TaxID=1858794 RepID=A0A2S8BBM0_9MYCO|nr:hypothetical protein C1Y40_05794 [Mycobacterium talmoniae]
MRAFTGRLLILAVLLLAGCADRGVDLAVSENGRALAGFTLARLRELRQVEIATPQSPGAQVQRGPTVRAVLDAAGATRVGKVRVEGRDPAQTLTADELTERVILSETKRHTLKLVGADLDRGRWVRDVTALVVNP